jgi:hypothetical protein
MVRFMNISNQVRTCTGPDVQVQVRAYGWTEHLHGSRFSTFSEPGPEVRTRTSVSTGKSVDKFVRVVVTTESKRRCNGSSYYQERINSLSKYASPNTVPSRRAMCCWFCPVARSSCSSPSQWPKVNATKLIHH